MSLQEEETRTERCQGTLCTEGQPREEEAGGQPSASQAGRAHRQPTWCWPSSLQCCGRIDVCYLSHPACGICHGSPSQFPEDRSSRLRTLCKGPNSSSHSSTGQSHIYHRTLEFQPPAPGPNPGPNPTKASRTHEQPQEMCLYLLLCFSFLSSLIIWLPMYLTFLSIAGGRHICISFVQPACRKPKLHFS